MKVIASLIDGVEIHGIESPRFETSLETILDGAPRNLLLPALPFSVIIENCSLRRIALTGIRFDMVGSRGKKSSVVHYADTLRCPQKGDFKPGCVRFVCAEPAYTRLALHAEPGSNARATMNLANLRSMLHLCASLDCVAFADGQFAGPDTQGAFLRFTHEREVESQLLEEVLHLQTAPLGCIEQLLTRAMEDPERARRAVARKLLDGLEAGGPTELLAKVASHHCRTALWRA
jgi:hypothetical protein